MPSKSETALVGENQADGRHSAAAVGGEDSPEESENLALIALVQENPSKGFPLLIERHGHTIDYLVRKFAHSPEDREDLYQEVVLALLKDGCHRLSLWDPNRAPFPAFLYMVVWRLCASYWKKVGRRQRIVGNPNPGVEEDRGSVVESLKTPATQRSDVAFSELSDQLEDCFDAIIQAGGAREEDRLLVQLRAEGQPAKLVGRLLGLGKDVVHTRFKRVRERLRDCLSQHGFRSIADVLTDLGPPGGIPNIESNSRREN